MIGDTGEQVGDVELRIDAVELGGFDQRVHRGGERAAAMFTLIETAKLNGIDPQAWLAMCWAASPITPSRGSISCCPGFGNATIKLPDPQLTAALAGCLLIFKRASVPGPGYGTRQRADRDGAGTG